MATDRQTTGMAGEFLVVGQLFKRELQASVTFGNAKAIDVLAHNPRTERNFSISVKTLRAPNCFLLNPQTVSKNHTYVFVILNAPGKPERFFILPGKDLSENMAKFFGSSLSASSHHAINIGPLQEYEGKWSYFEESA
jgi:hypothetical protein